MEKKLSFGEVIRDLRENQKIGSRELSKLVNKGAAYISQIEKGRNKNPDYRIAWTLLKILGVAESQRDELLRNYGIYPPSNEELQINFEESIKELRESLNTPDNDVVFIKRSSKEKRESITKKTIEVNKFLQVILDFNPNKAETIINELHDSLREQANKVIVERVHEIIKNTEDLATTLSLGNQLEKEISRRGLSESLNISTKKGEDNSGWINS